MLRLLVSFRRLNLSQIIESIFVNDPSFFFLIADNLDQTVFICNECNRITIFVYDRILLRIKQGKHGVLQAQLHIAGGIFHQVNAINRCRAATCVCAESCASSLVNIPFHLRPIAERDFHGIACFTQVFKQNLCVVLNDYLRCIRNRTYQGVSHHIRGVKRSFCRFYRLDINTQVLDRIRHGHRLTAIENLSARIHCNAESCPNILICLGKIFVTRQKLLFKAIITVVHISGRRCIFPKCLIAKGICSPCRRSSALEKLQRSLILNHQIID